MQRKTRLIGLVAAALDRLGAKADHVQPLFISVDPMRDTLGVVAKYVAAFTPHLIGLTSSPHDITAMEKKNHVATDMVRTGTDDYSIDHSAVLYLIGRMAGSLPHSALSKVAKHLQQISANISPETERR